MSDVVFKTPRQEQQKKFFFIYFQMPRAEVEKFPYDEALFKQ
jgi:hypothetical protein